MFECYVDGKKVCTFETEEEAEQWCFEYDGEGEATYEDINEYGLCDDFSECGGL